MREWNEKELEIIKEIEKIVDYTDLTLENIKEYADETRISLLGTLKIKTINHYVLEKYLHIDYLLGEHIEITIKKFSRKKKQDLWNLPIYYRLFIDSILEEISLLGKYQIYENIVKPSKKSKARDVIFKLNTLRNRIAHSYYPNFSPKYKIVYSDKSIYSADGFAVLREDVEEVIREIDTLHAKRYLKKRLPETIKTPLT